MILYAQIDDLSPMIQKKRRFGDKMRYKVNEVIILNDK